jgi:hypothetical protein
MIENWEQKAQPDCEQYPHRNSQPKRRHIRPIIVYKVGVSELFSGAYQSNAGVDLKVQVKSSMKIDFPCINKWASDNLGLCYKLLPGREVKLQLFG